MYINAILTVLKFSKKVWWLIPILGLCFYIWTLNSKIDNLKTDIKKKNETIQNQKEEISFQCQIVKNQKKKIEALKDQSKEKEKIEKKYQEEAKKNKKIIDKYKEDLKNKNKDKDKPILKRIRDLMPDRHTRKNDKKGGKKK